MNCVGWGRAQITFPSSPYGVKLRLPYNTGTANSASLRLRSVTGSANFTSFRLHSVKISVPKFLLISVQESYYIW